MKPLHRLPNGRWIDLVDVRGIMPLEAAPDTKSLLGQTPRVTVLLLGDDYTCLECSDWEGAQHLADELGTLCNAAREKVET